MPATHAVWEDSNWPIARTYLVEGPKISRPLVDELHARGSTPTIFGLTPGALSSFTATSTEGARSHASDARHQSIIRPYLRIKLTAWFAVGDLAMSDRIAAVESRIDGLSYYSLFGCRCGSLAVVSWAAATVPRELMLQAYDRCQTFVLALDNDPRASVAGKRHGRDTEFGRLQALVRL
jgi:hypothetical protein